MVDYSLLDDYCCGDTEMNKPMVRMKVYVQPNDNVCDMLVCVRHYHVCTVGVQR